MKKTWVAALLNIIPGLGYLYLGTRIVFAWLLIGAQLAFLLSMVETWDYVPSEDMPFTAWDVLFNLGITVAFIVDGYNEAKRINALKTDTSTK